MERIIKSELMSGSLLLIKEEYLIERYNIALLALIGKETKLSEFHIDISGFSPEIAVELDNCEYLNMGGTNQHIIILSPEQKNLPLLDPFFTSARYFIESFIEDNYNDVLNLTTKDVIYGEIQDNVVKVKSIEDIINVKKVKFEIESGKNILGKIEEFEKMEARIFQDEEAWYEDDVINEMIETAHIIGNIKKNKVSFDSLDFPTINFYTSHLGGVYKFQIKNKLFLISKDNNLPKSKDYTIINYDLESVLIFLLSSFKTKITFNDRIIKAKMEHLLIMDMIKAGCVEFDKSAKKKFEFDNYDNLNPLYLSLEKVYASIENNVHIDIEKLDRKTVASLLRLKNPKNEINFRLFSHLLSTFVLDDFTYLYAFNKEEFYKNYESLENDILRKYMSDYLVEHYVPKRKEIKKVL